MPDQTETKGEFLRETLGDENYLFVYMSRGSNVNLTISVKRTKKTKTRD